MPDRTATQRAAPISSYGRLVVPTRGCSTESVRREVAGDLVEVALPSAAASTPDVDVRVLLGDGTHAPAQVGRVTGFEMPERAQRGLVHHRCVGAQATDPQEPVSRL